MNISIFKINLFLLLLLFPFISKADCTNLEDYVRSYLSIYPKRQEKALTYIPSICKYSKRYGIDPLLVAITISFESAWIKEAKGKRYDEIGLMQVHGQSTKGFKSLEKSADQQIEAGTKWLAKSIQRCGNIQEGINAYLSKGGRCKPILKRAKYRYNVYLRLKKVYK